MKLNVGTLAKLSGGKGVFGRGCHFLDSDCVIIFGFLLYRCVLFGRKICPSEGCPIPWFVIVLIFRMTNVRYFVIDMAAHRKTFPIYRRRSSQWIYDPYPGITLKTSHCEASTLLALGVINEIPNSEFLSQMKSLKSVFFLVEKRKLVAWLVD